MWKYNEEWNYWSITKSSGFVTLTFDLWELNSPNDRYRLLVRENSNSFQDFSAKDFEDAKLAANELIYDALRWNN